MTPLTKSWSIFTAGIIIGVLGCLAVKALTADNDFGKFQVHVFEAYMDTFSDMKKGPGRIDPADLQAQTGTDSTSFHHWINSLVYMGYLSSNSDGGEKKWWEITPVGVAKYESIQRERAAHLDVLIQVVLGVLAGGFLQWLISQLSAKNPTSPSCAQGQPPPLL